METDITQTDSAHRPVPTWSFKHVRRRLQPDNAFFEDGDVACCILLKQIPLDEDEDENMHDRVPEFKCHEAGCKEFFTSVSAYEMHYNSKHRHVCSHCKRFFPSDHLLDIHILEWHDTMFQILAQTKNMYRCLIQACNERFPTAAKRKQHLVKHHKYPSNFRFDKPVRKSKSEVHRTRSSTAKDCEAMDTSNKDIDTLSQTMETVQVTPGTRVYRVPKTISFGRGVARGFERSPRHQGQSKKQSRKKNKPAKTKDSIADATTTDKMDI
ncbi:zinc finger protein 511-like [Ptychodera flava]|uniref:zinc finger protein 511-like n=1 Tax=Ptychodera flava TaxID=63121 RepID=UPI003969CC39